MKKLAFIFVAMIVVLSTSCGNSAKREQEIRDSLRADSIMKDSILRAKLDSIRQDSIRQDSLRRIRVTPDMAFLNVHGPVKTVKDEEGKTWEFTPEWKLKSTPSGYICNSKGYVVKKATPYDEWTYKYNDNMQLSQKSYVNTESGGECGFNGNYSYNEQGFISSFISKGWEEETVLVESTRYKYINLDEYGNWTSRSWVLNIKENNPYMEEGMTSHIDADSGTHRRTITYYE